MKTSKELVESYLGQSDWRVNENSSCVYSFGGMNKYIDNEVQKDYWLHHIYTPEIRKAHGNGDMHIHDLGGLTLYCCGYSLQSLLLMGIKNHPTIPSSKPAKHFGSILNQIANMATVFQNEIMGAVAFNSVDTLLAPFIKVDKLTYDQVKQELQNFVYSINSNSRVGAEPAFTNCTFDLIPPYDLANKPCIIGGEMVDFTYSDCQREMDMFNQAFWEIMLEGDADGKLFSYPIPTYNITNEFDWNNPNYKLLWDLTGKYGTPYFANFCNSDMDVRDIRSMCCRLSLNLKELRRKNGGLFGAGDSTGSIGVVTINMPRLGYKAQGDEKEFFKLLDEVLELAKDSLEIKRKWVNENILEKGLIPAFQTYVGTMDNHFSSIGDVGLNEMCVNFFGDTNKGIKSAEGKAFAEKVCQHFNEKLLEFQEETGHLYNFEHTPAESTCYRLALKDKNLYPDIFTQGQGDGVYYTNSCHIPVKEIETISKTFEHQNNLQKMATGGTVIHIYMGTGISGDHAKHIVRTVCKNYEVPYISISPISRICPDHGYIHEEVDTCPICGKPLDKYQRITGYLRNTKNFNKGKQSEFKERKQLNENSL